MKEKDLLSSFLVGNELHDSVTLQQFTKFFPSAYRSHPEVKDLYRAYLNSRHQVRNKVRRNIEIEVRRNPFHLEEDVPAASASTTSSSSLPETAALSAEASTEHDSDMDLVVIGAEDMDIEDVDKHLTLDQAIQELALAERIFKNEIEQLEKECATFATEFQDLDREYDSVRMPQEQSVEGVDQETLMKDLQSLIQLCDSITEGVPSEDIRND